MAAIFGVIFLVVLTTMEANALPSMQTFKRGAVGLSSEAEIRDEALNGHNAKRSQHENTPSLVWDGSLYSEATSYANFLATQGGGIQHSSGAMAGAYGENLYFSSSSLGAKTVSQAITSWYAESDGYDYNSNSMTSGKGHFTQMVWAANINVGCGRATLNTGTKINTYIVCMYTPGGNINGYFTQNVHALKGAGGGCTEPDWCPSLAASCNVASLAGVLGPCVKTCNRC